MNQMNLAILRVILVTRLSLGWLYLQRNLDLLTTVSVRVNVTMKDIKKFSTVDIAGYCVGDFIGKDTYEVVTAWVDPRYKGIDLAVKVKVLYVRIYCVDVFG